MQNMDENLYLLKKQASNFDFAPFVKFLCFVG